MQKVQKAKQERQQKKTPKLRSQSQSSAHSSHFHFAEEKAWWEREEKIKQQQVVQKQTNFLKRKSLAYNPLEAARKARKSLQREQKFSQTEKDLENLLHRNKEGRLEIHSERKEVAPKKEELQELTQMISTLT